jgi:uncharacterized protein DUF1360
MATERVTYPRAVEPGEPTEPVDYAAINAVYGALLTAVVLTTRERAREDPISGRELVPIAAATFALSKVIAREKIGSWMREPFVDDPTGARKPRGRRLQRAVGELVTCTRCLGAWSALAVVGLRLASPDSGRTVTNVLAASAANDWLQAGFRLLCAASNRSER